MGNASLRESIINPEIQAILAYENKFGDLLIGMQENMQNWKTEKNKEIVDLVRVHGPLKAKAFPGRAAIFIKLLGLDESSINCVYEKPGSMKIDHYLPGTRIPIKSDDELFAMVTPPAVIVNMAWHISTEIHQFLRKKGFQGEIIDIYDPNWLKNK